MCLAIYLKTLCVETLHDEPKEQSMVKRKSRPRCENDVVSNQGVPSSNLGWVTNT